MRIDFSKLKKMASLEAAAIAAQNALTPRERRAFKMVTANSSEWYNSLSAAAKKKYVQEHPNSEFAPAKHKLYGAIHSALHSPKGGLKSKRVGNEQWTVHRYADHDAHFDRMGKHLQRQGFVAEDEPDPSKQGMAAKFTHPQHPGHLVHMSRQRGDGSLTIIHSAPIGSEKASVETAAPKKVIKPLLKAKKPTVKAPNPKKTAARRAFNKSVKSHFHAGRTLSEEHKKAISEGLKRWHAAHGRGQYTGRERRHAINHINKHIQSKIDHHLAKHSTRRELLRYKAARHDPAVSEKHRLKARHHLQMANHLKKALLPLTSKPATPLPKKTRVKKPIRKVA